MLPQERLRNLYVRGSLTFNGVPDNLLESQKQELETVVKTTDLRQQENEQYAKIIDLTNEYIRDRDEYSKNARPDLNNRILQLRSQLDVMKDNFMTLEKNLARLENRQPRKITIDFIPPEPPTNLQVIVR